MIGSYLIVGACNMRGDGKRLLSRLVSRLTALGEFADSPAICPVGVLCTWSSSASLTAHIWRSHNFSVSCLMYTRITRRALTASLHIRLRVLENYRLKSHKMFIAVVRCDRQHCSEDTQIEGFTVHQGRNAPQRQNERTRISFLAPRTNTFHSMDAVPCPKPGRLPRRKLPAALEHFIQAAF